MILDQHIFDKLTVQVEVLPHQQMNLDIRTILDNTRSGCLMLSILKLSLTGRCCSSSRL